MTHDNAIDTRKYSKSLTGKNQMLIHSCNGILIFVKYTVTPFVFLPIYIHIYTI